ncbi:hypothetical protein GCM10012275_59420 [Longimycelium tulufanense]|uniref:Uncharacterized protein n=1 Tax=Longimycelium tulufanense TaxID=907463 RepID=A0A8J3CE98_9PSEU|nr:hypothetical protein [Longimycelium tulufanense]GGM80905.1 hypothetical protein GCM10012275_59420 [Longimycelium tulufanense]
MSGLVLLITHLAALQYARGVHRVTYLSHERIRDDWERAVLELVDALAAPMLVLRKQILTLPAYAPLMVAVLDPDSSGEVGRVTRASLGVAGAAAGAHPAWSMRAAHSSMLDTKHPPPCCTASSCSIIPVRACSVATPTTPKCGCTAACRATPHVHAQVAGRTRHADLIDAVTASCPSVIGVARAGTFGEFPNVDAQPTDTHHHRRLWDVVTRYRTHGAQRTTPPA